MIRLLSKGGRPRTGAPAKQPDTIAGDGFAFLHVPSRSLARYSKRWNSRRRGPDPFRQRNRRSLTQASSQLEQAIQQAASQYFRLVVLAGAPGSGKTAVLQSVQRDSVDRTYHAQTVARPARPLKFPSPIS